MNQDFLIVKGFHFLTAVQTNDRKKVQLVYNAKWA